MSEEESNDEDPSESQDEEDSGNEEEPDLHDSDFDEVNSKDDVAATRDVKNEEVKEDDEESDEDVETKALFEQISNLQEEDIGQFSVSNEKFIKLSNRFAEIRETGGLFNFQVLPDELSALMKTKLLNGVYKNFRGMYEFIIHMHKVYEVPLDENAGTYESNVLLDTMECAFRKYVNHCSIILNTSPTIVQSISM
jgi:hypothetical protein